MTSMAVLAQADSVATWIGAISGSVGAIGTITVAIIVYRWDRRRHMAERREREAEQRTQELEQAKLVIIGVDPETPGLRGTFKAVTIKNGGKTQCTDRGLSQLARLTRARDIRGS